MTEESISSTIDNSSLKFQYFDAIKAENNATIFTSGPHFDLVQNKYFGILVYPLIIISVYVFLGLIGNSIVLYIFSVKWKRNKTSVFIITLAVLDIINCSVNMPIEIAVLSRPLSFDYEMFCKFARCLSYITTASYSFLLVAVAFDRYLMVCRPLKRMTLGKQYAKKTCIGAVLLGVLTQWPSIIIYGTFELKIPIPQPNNTTFSTTGLVVLGKTCLVTNYYYYENPTLTYAFQGFLFVGHVVIFSALTITYIIIGKRLYISSHTNFDSGESKSGHFQRGLLSAITGSVLCGRKTKSISTDNLNTKPIRISTLSEVSNANTRFSTVSSESGATGILQGKQSPSVMGNWKGTTDIYEGSEYDKNKCNKRDSCTYSAANQKVDLRINYTSTNSQDTDHSLETTFNNKISIKSQRQMSQPNTNRRSSDLPSPSLAYPFLPRSISMDGSQLLSTCLEKPKKLDLKELSLKRNTLIMRMVTFTFMLSYLPFLIIVTLRYSNSDIPGKLSRTPLIVYHVFLRSYFFNSVIRPFIYACMNEEYRFCVLQLLRIRKMR